MTKQPLLTTPLTSLDELHPELVGEPIDRIELLPHLGSWAFITGRAMKYSAIPAAAKEAIRIKTGIKDFKSFVLINNVEVRISNNNLEAHQRDVIHLDHLWMHVKESQHVDLYQANTFLGQIILYQRSNCSLSLGTICMPACSYNLTRGLTQVIRYTDEGFLADMDVLARTTLQNFPMHECARIINQLCDDAILMAENGTLHLSFYTTATFKKRMKDCWRSEWMILAGVRGTVNRAGRRVARARPLVDPGQRRVKEIGLPPTHREKSVKGFA